jgi:hypothetical protein
MKQSHTAFPEVEDMTVAGAELSPVAASVLPMATVWLAPFQETEPATPSHVPVNVTCTVWLPVGGFISPQIWEIPFWPPPRFGLDDEMAADMLVPPYVTPEITLLEGSPIKATLTSTNRFVPLAVCDHETLLTPVNVWADE